METFDHIDVQGPYPLALRELNVVVALDSLADPDLAYCDAGELVQHYRDKAVAVLDHADWLEQLTARGWMVTRVGGDLALREIAELDEAIELAPGTALFARGYPIEVHAPAYGEIELVPAGGFRAGIDPPAGAFPPAMLPALVACEPSGRQLIVETDEALREMIVGEVRELGERWAERELDLHERGGELLLDELDRLADAIDTQRIEVPLDHAAPRRAPAAAV